MNEAELSKFGDTEIQKLDKRSKDFQQNSRSDATKSAYRNDWQSFSKWCTEHNLDFLPCEPSTVRRYITNLAEIGRATSTISRSMTSIRQAHQTMGFTSPTAHPDVIETWKGIKREIGTRKRRAKPLMLTDLKKVVDSTRPTMIGRRDVALILIGWAGALRRSELVALNREDLEFVTEGMIITISKSKTDQEREGYRIGIPLARDEKYCPTKRVQQWMTLAKIESGPIFFKIGMGGKKFHCLVENRKSLSPRMINLIIQRRMKRAGLDIVGYSGHSLRAGFVTSAAKAETPEALIQLHTRHKTSKVLREYIRDGSLFNSNPLSILI